MANKRWLPRALDRAQVDQVVVANTWATGDTQVATINEKEITVTVGATSTTAAVATAVKEAINGDTATGDATRSETGDNIPEFQELTATVNSSTVTLTGNTKGVPFTLSSAETTAGTGTATASTVTAATGSHFWSDVDNWGGSAIPADSDVVYLDHSDVSVLYGLNQSSIQPAEMYVPLSFTGQVGLPQVNEAGGYAEYRDTYLRIGPAALQIGAGAGNGSGRLKFDSGTDICALTVLGSGSSADELPAVLWKGTNAGNTLVLRGGTLGVALFGGEAATLDDITVDGGELTLGAGVTLTGDIVVNGGSVVISSHVDGTLTVTGGAVVIEGAGAVDQLTVRGGVVTYNTTGTLGGNTVVSGSGVLDFSQASGAVSVTNPIDLFGQNCQVLDPLKRLGSVVLDLNEGGALTQVALGTNLRVTRGDVA